MPNVTAPALAFPPKSFQGSPAGVPSGIAGEILYSALMAKYSTLVKAGKVYSAYATVTAPVIFSTAAGTGGPFLWNKPSSGVDAHILAVGLSVSVASGVAGAIGLTGAGGMAITPTNTAIDATGNCYVGGGASQMGGVYRVATAANPGSVFLPLFNVGTTATTAMFGSTLIDVGGAMVVPPGCFGAVAASATLTSFAAGITLFWAELPS